MKVPAKLRAIGIGNWFELCVKGGAAIIVFGLIGMSLEGYFEFIIPIGATLVIIPMLLILPSIILLAIYYIITSPIRLWLMMRIWMMDKQSSPNDTKYMDLRSNLDSLDQPPAWLFWWNRDLENNGEIEK